MDKVKLKEEMAYRRGYSQGWYFSRMQINKHITFSKILAWRNDLTKKWPPGSSHFYFPPEAK